MPVKDTTNTFDDYAVELQQIFDEKKWESRLKQSTDFCYLAVSQTLLTENQMKAMIDTLTEKLTDPVLHGPIPVIYFLQFSSAID